MHSTNSTENTDHRIGTENPSDGETTASTTPATAPAEAPEDTSAPAAPPEISPHLPSTRVAVAGNVLEGEPRPTFFIRHEIGIARAIAVTIVVLVLLLVWQGEASGQEAGDSSGETTEKSPPPRTARKIAEASEKKHFDQSKLEKFIRELEKKKDRDEATRPATEEGSPRDGAREGALAEIENPAATEGTPARADRSDPTKKDPKPTAEVIIPPVQGPRTPHPGDAAPRATGLDLPTDPDPISAVPAADLEWHDGFELALALQTEFAELQPVEIPALKTVLYQHLLEFSRLAGRSDNPLERMTALSELLTDGLRILVTDDSTLETLLPANVLAERRASSIGWCVLALALADRTRDLVLDPIVCEGELALRYENGAHRYVLSPLATDRVLTDREFTERVAGVGRFAEIRPLSRPEFWGHVIAEGGIDQVSHGAWARGMGLIEEGLSLDPRQPRARVAQAHGFLERRNEVRALECLDAAVLLDPSDRTARRARVELLLDLGRTDAAADDLAFLARDLSDPLDTVRYADWWLERREYRRAHATLLPVLETVNADSETGRAAHALATEIAAAPWVALLRDGSDDRARLRAARRLGEFSLPEAREALIAVLDDRNGHLANVALAVLRTATGWSDLPRDAEAWRRAFAERETTGITPAR